MAQIFSSIFQANPHVEGHVAPAPNDIDVVEKIRTVITQCANAHAPVIDFSSFDSLPLSDVAAALTAHRFEQPCLVVLPSHVVSAADVSPAFNDAVKQAGGVGPLYVPSGNAQGADSIKKVIDAFGETAIEANRAKDVVHGIRKLIAALRDGTPIVDCTALQQHFPAQALIDGNFMKTVFLVDPNLKCRVPTARPGADGLRVASKGGKIGMDKQVFPKLADWETRHANFRSIVDCIYGQSTVLDLTCMRARPELSKETIKALRGVKEIKTSNMRMKKYAKGQFPATTRVVVQTFGDTLNSPLTGESNGTVGARHIDGAGKPTAPHPTAPGRTDGDDALTVGATEGSASGADRSGEVIARVNSRDGEDDKPTLWRRFTAKLGACLAAVWHLLVGRRAMAPENA